MRRVGKVVEVFMPLKLERLRGDAKRRRVTATRNYDSHWRHETANPALPRRSHESAVTSRQYVSPLRVALPTPPSATANTPPLPTRRSHYAPSRAQSAARLSSPPPHKRLAPSRPGRPYLDPHAPPKPDTPAFARVRSCRNEPATRRARITRARATSFAAPYRGPK